MNGSRREVTPPPIVPSSPKVDGGDIDMQVANFLAEIESIDMIDTVSEEATPEVGDAGRKDEETFDMIGILLVGSLLWCLRT
jgi:hypothetical protein